ncbi:MAG: hypothetical protein LBE12_13615 [Planctomycetaceae bacterium]|jgi:hypothetical protein|nr:hypothetical protein [Planctomycetaceae bacterium]
MKNSLTFLAIAFILAGVASALNFFWYKNNVPETTAFAVFSKKINKGETIKADALRPLNVLSSNKTLVTDLNQHYLLFSDRNVIIDSESLRNYRQGELVRRRDIGMTEPISDYSILGPFRLLSVGNRIVTGMEDQSEDLQNSGDNAVTIAIRPDENDGAKKLNDNTARLMQIIENQKLRKSPSPELRIVGVVAYPTNKSEKKKEGEKPTFQLNDGEMALFVPLPGVKTIPEILLTGKEPLIGFLIPTLAVPPQASAQYSPQEQ